MSVVINTNLDALRAQSQIARNADGLSQIYERLSTGQRINRTSDDPAGLSLLELLRVDTKLATVALRNTNDAISLVSVADSALEEIGNILQRMAELAEQSANGTYSNTQRSVLSLEFQALGSEVERIAQTSKFNDLNLLSGSQAVIFQIGLDGSANSRVQFNGQDGTLQGIQLGQDSQLTYSVIADTEHNSKAAARTALAAVQNAIEGVAASRGMLGAAESRLETSISTLNSLRDNFDTAASRIGDADIAADAARLVMLQVRQQAAIAIAAQANQQPGIALQLLQ